MRVSDRLWRVGGARRRKKKKVNITIVEREARHVGGRKREGWNESE